MQIRMQNELFVWCPTLPHPVKPNPGPRIKTDYDNNNWCKIQMNQFLLTVWSWYESFEKCLLTYSYTQLLTYLEF